MVQRTPHLSRIHFGGGYLGLALIKLNEYFLALAAPEVCFFITSSRFVLFYVKGGPVLSSEIFTQYKLSTVNAGDLL